jgi:hypothetical protein
VALLLVVYSTHAVRGRWFLLAQAKQVPRARYARRRRKTSRGRHLFASDEELVAGLDV